MTREVGRADASLPVPVAGVDGTRERPALSRRVPLLGTHLARHHGRRRVGREERDLKRRKRPAGHRQLRLSVVVHEPARTAEARCGKRARGTCGRGRLLEALAAQLLEGRKVAVEHRVTCRRRAARARDDELKIWRERLACDGVAEADAQLAPLKSRNDGVAVALPDSSDSSLTCGVFRLGLRGRGRAVCGGDYGMCAGGCGTGPRGGPCRSRKRPVHGCSTRRLSHQDPKGPYFVDKLGLRARSRARSPFAHAIQH